MNSADRLIVVSDRRCSGTKAQLMSNAKLVVCPHCDSIKRVPADQLDQRPNCGVCHKSLLNGQPPSPAEIA
ncbi:MAG: hypothetical protein ACE5H7_16370, partial [Acidiferrobacterales bacterium]